MKRLHVTVLSIVLSELFNTRENVSQTLPVNNFGIKISQTVALRFARSVYLRNCVRENKSQRLG